MLNRQLKRNIKDLDVKIGKLNEELDKQATDGERKKIVEQIKDLADLRNKLSESKTKESLAPLLIPGGVALFGMFMVIRHEETNVLTSKALAMAQKLFRG